VIVSEPETSAVRNPPGAVGGRPETTVVVTLFDTP